MGQILEYFLYFSSKPTNAFCSESLPPSTWPFFFFLMFFMGNFKYIHNKIKQCNKPHATVIQLLQLSYFHNLVLSIYIPLSHPELFEIIPDISLVTICMHQEFSAYVLQ